MAPEGYEFLASLEGIVEPVGGRREKPYEITLEKAKAYTWEEIEPRIIETIARCHYGMQSTDQLIVTHEYYELDSRGGMVKTRTTVTGGEEKAEQESTQADADQKQ